MPDAADIALVLGGGGHRGAFEVGMLKAILEAGIKPDVIVGTSIGAFNGASIAAEPSMAGVEALEEIWLHLKSTEVFSGSIWQRAAGALRQKVYMHSNAPLRELLEQSLTARDFADLAVPFQCVAASIEEASEHWFSEGPLIDAILASSAVPGLLPPVKIGNHHYIDGGVVNSIPVSRAVELGASEIWVAHVGHIDDRLEAPAKPWDVALVAFEIARRHRFWSDVRNLPATTTIHVLPTGKDREAYNEMGKLKYADFSVVSERIETAYQATIGYLEELP